MTQIDLLKLKAENIECNLTDLKNKLLPVLQQKGLSRKIHDLKNWANMLVNELRDGLSLLLPLNKNEVNFINQLRKEKVINPSLITHDTILHKKIKQHPAILWACKKSNNQ